MGIERSIVERGILERERHCRALWYALVAFGLSICAYLFLGFDRSQALGYAVSCFVMLNIVNFRVMFARLPSEPERQRSVGRQ